MPSPLDSFHPVVRAWFNATFGTPTPPQAEGWPAIAAGENALILAPTGSGKTLAAFLKCLDQLYHEGPAERAGVRVLYISPLKALNNDIHRNLEVPLRGIEAEAARQGVALPRLTTAVRTGDTSQRERAAMLRRPPDVLITTPESLYLLLTSRGREILRSVRYVIVDEIHALAGNKRGAHLTLSLERLEALTAKSPVRIGLSATQRPLSEIAHFLGGTDRPVRIIDTGTRKQLDLLIEVPLDDMRALPENTMWAAIHPRLLELIERHRSTLIFVNYRGLAERLAGKLNALAGREVVRVHHGSMSREQREAVERELKEGQLPCLVATASLELGIDIGALDLVIQVESPKSAARGLQRVGRAGHIVGAASKGRMLPKYRGDLVEMACIAREMLHGRVEATRVTTGALDVLAQQIIAMAGLDEWRTDDLLRLVRRSYCYRDLSERQLNLVLTMLAGEYPATDIRDLKPRIVWDRAAGLIRGRENARAVAVLAGGTIPDRGYFGIYVQGSNVRLGEMDEEFVYEARVGEVFLLGTASWRIEAIERDRMLVSPAFSATPKMPFWKGDGLGRPYELGLRLGTFLREASERLDNDDLTAWLAGECALDRRAAANLATYLRDQRDAVGVLPNDRRIVVETFPDELGDQRIVILSPYGGRVHLAWMTVLQRRVRELRGVEPELTQTDDGIMLRLPAGEQPLDVRELLRVDPARARDIVAEEIGNTPLFGACFRMNAGRALVLPRPRPGRRQPFWLQRLRAADLLQVVRKLDSFPVVVETYREVLNDILDLPGLTDVLTRIASGELAVETVETVVPSPFAASLQMGFIGAFMYEGETPRAERRGALLGVNRDLLREVLGGEQLRSLLDRRAIAAVDDRLQRRDPDWRPRNADETEEMLRQIGDLTALELAERGVPAEWLERLRAEGRVVPALVAGESRLIAAADAGLYATLAVAGQICVGGGDSADAFEAVGAVIRRYARNHGPFSADAAVARYALPVARVTTALDGLLGEGVLVTGEYTPGVSGREYCDVEALQQIHRLTLAFLRREIEPVDGATFARFLAEWQGLTGGSQSGASAVAGAAGGVSAEPTRLSPLSAPPPLLKRVLKQLQGLALPAECWERDVLPPRVPGYQPLWLDQLCALGEVRWTMNGGRVAFYLTDADPLPSPGASDGDAAGVEPDAESGRVLAALAMHGAAFLGSVARAAELSSEATLEALLRLTAAGRVTNDTLAPVRLQQGPRATGKARRLAMLQRGTGRWSVVAAAATVTAGADPAQHYAQVLLARYGVVTREIVQAEALGITWGEVADVLKLMELRGQVRRGHFLAGLSGAQFAHPDAVERLRGARERRTGNARLLTVADPANPYGVIVPLPAEARLTRVPSSQLVLIDGLPVLAVEGYGKRLTPLASLDDAQLRQALGCLRQLLGGPAAVRRRRVEVEEWDGGPVTTSPVAPVLEELGFQRGPWKYVLYR